MAGLKEGVFYQTGHVDLMQTKVRKEAEMSGRGSPSSQAAHRKSVALLDFWSLPIQRVEGRHGSELYLLDPFL